MNKKIISAFVAMALTVSPALTFAQTTDISAKEFTQRFGIMTGYGDGNFGEYDTLVRSQFVKMTVKIVDKDFIPVNNTAPYTDVPYTHWAASYIDRASQLGYFAGYPDGSFHPDEPVLTEHVCKTMLKILGYETDYTADNWAYAQVELARQKGLLDGVEYALGQPLNRINTAKVIQNTLLTKAKNAQNYYIETMGYQYKEDVIPISDKNVPAGYVATSAGTVKKGVLSDSQLLQRGDMILDNDNTIVMFIEKPNQNSQYLIKEVLPDRITVKDNSGEKQLILEKDTVVYSGNSQSVYSAVFNQLKNGDYIKVFYRADGTIDYLSVVTDTNVEDTDEYIIKTVLSDGVVAFSDEGDKTIKFDDDTPVYEGSLSSVYQTASQGFALGDKITVYYDNIGGVKYLKLEKDAIKGPVTNKGKSFITALGAREDSKILRDGISASVEDIEDNDICYYVEQGDTILAYSKKISGIYEDAIPNKDAIKQVKLSGKTYDIGTSQAFAKLSSDALEYGDMITLLFGKDGKVADVVTGKDTGPVTAYIMNSGLKETTNPNQETKKSYYIQVLLTDGQTMEYISDKDYEDYRGRLASLSFQNGKAAVKTINNPKSDVYGEFDWESKTFGKDKLAKDLMIIDVASYEKDYSGTGKRIYPNRLDGLDISRGAVLYTAKNTKGEINRLVLNDYTNDIYSFGIVLKSAKASSAYAAQGSYELLVDGNVSNVTSYNEAFSANSRQPSLFKYDNTQLRSINPLGAVRDIITKADVNYAYGDSEKYPMSADVQVYRDTSGYLSGKDFELIPVSEIPAGATMTAYMDKPAKSGGRVRVLILN